MRNFQDTFETRKRSFISVFSISMTITLKSIIKIYVATIESVQLSTTLKTTPKVTTRSRNHGTNETNYSRVD